MMMKTYGYILHQRNWIWFLIFIFQVCSITFVQCHEDSTFVSPSSDKNALEQQNAFNTTINTTTSISTNAAHSEFLQLDTDMISSDSCNSHTECTECYESSYACHWCNSDSQCHAKGSIHGCAVGNSCSDTPPKNSSDDNHCISHTNCTACYGSSYACHWCASDNQCHARGSIHGCAIGSSCENSTDNSCGSHTNCTECTLSSVGCHWCAFDNQCHALGSIYGCTEGVNCYSNDRCQRKTPETKYSSLSITPLIDGLLLTTLLGSICCCTFCFCGVRGVQHAMDDYVEISQIPYGQTEYEKSMTIPLLPMPNKDRPLSMKVEEQSSLFELTSSITTKGNSNGNETGYNQEEDNQEEEEEDNISNTFSNPSPTSEVMIPPSNPKFKNARILYNTCKVFYAISIITMITFTYLTFLFFPRIPVIDICNNEVEWQSLIDGLTSLKVQASSQILVSIYNPNRIDFNLATFTGKISHDGDYIGTFELPENIIIASQSIIDVLATVTITPDKWEALELTSEYYKGTLTVLLDVHASVGIPILEGYNYGYKDSDYVVHLNGAEGPRELCACPTWKNVYNPNFEDILFSTAIN